jgi:hypothetical protein
MSVIYFLPILRVKFHQGGYAIVGYERVIVVSDIILMDYPHFQQDVQKQIRRYHTP